MGTGNVNILYVKAKQETSLHENILWRRIKNQSLLPKFSLYAMIHVYRFSYQEMTCNLDEHITKKSGNMLHKAKLSVYTQQGQDQQLGRDQSQASLQSRPPAAAGKSRAAKELLDRISKCAASKFAPNLEKCCKYRQQFMKELADCSKKFRGKHESC